jgi:glycosyltransferase involved in cell wall biosynthesis
VGESGDRKFCVIIPAYREEGRIGKVIEGVSKHAEHVVVVDDGSPDNTAAEAEKAGALVLRHGVNRGKGIALNTGFDYARKNGFEFVITLDADGQHDPDDIPAFVDAYRRTGTPVLIGNRMDRADNMPWVRWLTNKYMSWLLSRQMGQHVPDTQVGYRLFRCDVIPTVPEESGRFAAESEILMLLAEKGVRIGAVPVKVIYRDEKSKIHPIKDTLRFYSMLRRHKKMAKGQEWKETS